MAVDARALQYAACTWALEQDLRAPGSEATFDQAVTNGLAAIVAHDYPDMLRKGSRVRSAAELLHALEPVTVASETPGVLRLPHTPGEPITWTTFDIPGLEGDVPNFTELHARQLHDAIDRTQAVRHARPSTDVSVLQPDDLAALRALDHHPALFALSQEAHDRLEAATIRDDAAERGRAAAYLELLDDDEVTRRREAAEWSMPRREPGADQEDECPVCDSDAMVNESLAASADICLVCSYRRSADMQELMHIEAQIEEMMRCDD